MKYKSTVIVVVYNHADTVESCLRSVFSNANSKECEIIVHDDCSTDGSRKIIEDTMAEWQGPFTLIFPRENRHSKGEEFGIEILAQADGETIFMIEGDDRWDFDEDRTSVMSEYLLSDGTLSMVFTDTKKVDWNTKQVSWLLPQVLKGRVSALDLSRVNYSFMLLGACCFRNKPINFPKEFFACKYRDVWFPMLWSVHGDAEYVDRGGQLVYNYTGKGLRSGASNQQFALDKLSLGCLLLSYFINIGDLSAAQNNLWRFNGAAQIIRNKEKVGS